MQREYDTIIIGGGVVGSGIAFHLSEVQKNGIAVIDRGFPMCGASGANMSYVLVHTKTPAWYGELSWYSAQLYKDLHQKIGNFEYKRSGGIKPFFTPEEREAAHKLAESQAEGGVEIEVLSRDEALAKEPALSPAILGATYCAIDGHVNPMRLVQQYMRAAKANGVTYETYNEFQGAEKSSGSFVVSTGNGALRCRRLILCVGVRTNEVAKQFGIDIPVRPVRGQIVVTEPVAPLLKHIVVPIRQTANGEVLIGVSTEEAGFDRRTTLDTLSRMVQDIIKVIPALAKASAVRSFAGLRPYPKDGFPIVSSIPGVEGLYVAVMHSGVTLSPLVGTLMTELLTRGETSLPIDRLSVTRFH